ncbi:hypothetical protein AMECASPLE_027975, partial [Ameca splendens]
METLGIILKNLTHDIFNALEIATTVLGETEVNDTISIHLDNIVVFLYKPTDDFRGLTISASDNKTSLNGSEELSDSRIIGLSVHGKNISGLQERVSLTIKTATSMN